MDDAARGAGLEEIVVGARACTARTRDLNATLHVESVLDERHDLRVRDEDALPTFEWTLRPRTIGVDLTQQS